MILSDEEVQEKIESPLNLLNRLRSSTRERSIIPSLPPPRSDEVIDDLEDKIKIGSIRQKAAGIMADALGELKNRMSELKPEKLAQVAAEMNKVLLTRPESDDKDKRAQIVVYAPQVVQENYFETIVASE